MGDTSPDDLLPLKPEITTSYEQQSGSVCQTAEG